MFRNSCLDSDASTAIKKSIQVCDPVYLFTKHFFCVGEWLVPSSSPDNLPTQAAQALVTDFLLGIFLYFCTYSPRLDAVSSQSLSSYKANM